MAASQKTEKSGKTSSRNIVPRSVMIRKRTMTDRRGGSGLSGRKGTDRKKKRVGGRPAGWYWAVVVVVTLNDTQGTEGVGKASLGSRKRTELPNTSRNGQRTCCRNCGSQNDQDVKAKSVAQLPQEFATSRSSPKGSGSAANTAAASSLGGSGGMPPREVPQLPAQIWQQKEDWARRKLQFFYGISTVNMPRTGSQHRKNQWNDACVPLSV